MHIFAFAIIIVKHVGGFESEDLGYPYHSAKIIKNPFYYFEKTLGVIFAIAYFCNSKHNIL